MAALSVWDAVSTLVQTRNRVLRVSGASPREPEARVAVTMDEGPMREAMFAYSERILLLSLAISALTAAAVFLALHWLMVRPMRRLTDAMVRFGADPEDQSRIHSPSGRSDEIGTAERQLAGMQRRLHAALSHRAHLAAVGEGVAKINHDLRNMLASAQLVSDSLGESRDPRVRKAVPTLVGALDRAGRPLHAGGRFRARRRPPAHPGGGSAGGGDGGCGGRRRQGRGMDRHRGARHRGGGRPRAIVPRLRQPRPQCGGGGRADGFGDRKGARRQGVCDGGGRRPRPAGAGARKPVPGPSGARPGRTAPASALRSRARSCAPMAAPSG